MNYISLLLMIEIHYLSLLKMIINEYHFPEEFDPDKAINGDIGLWCIRGIIIIVLLYGNTFFLPFEVKVIKKFLINLYLLSGMFEFMTKQ